MNCKCFFNYTCDVLVRKESDGSYVYLKKYKFNNYYVLWFSKTNRIIKDYSNYETSQIYTN